MEMFVDVSNSAAVAAEIEPEELVIPEPSAIAKGAKEIRDSFDQKQRERIRKAQALILSDASEALHELSRKKVTPPDVELAVLVAGLEKAKAPENTKVEFLDVLRAAFPKLEKTWLKNLRVAVKNILKAPSRSAAQAMTYNLVNLHDFRHQVGHGLRELERANKHNPTLFRYGSEVAEIRTDPLTGAAAIETLSFQVFKARVNAVAEYRRLHLDGESSQGVSVPEDVAQTLYAHPELPLPVLRGITRTPVFDTEGNLIKVPGYHRASGLYYAPPPDFAVDLPSGRVSAEDVTQAIADLCDLFCDFEMDGLSREAFTAAVLRGEGDKQWRLAGTRARSAVPPSFLACVAWMLEQPCRPMIAGPVMGLLVSKTTPGAGGGLLAKVMQMIVQGSTASRQLAKSEDERRKAIFTALKGSPPTVFWDNLRAGHEVDSAALASLLTEPVWTDRELGRSGERSLMVTASFIFVGNRPLFSDELRRRLSLCELLPQVADPAARDTSSFAHPDLFGDVKRDRVRYVRALLVLVLNWIQQGRPSPKYSVAPGSYDEWHRVVVGILEAAAPHWKSWGANRSKLDDVAGSDDTTEIDTLLALWAQEYGLGQPVEASALCTAVAQARLELPLKPARHGDECEYSSKSLGRYLKSFAGRVFEVETKDGEKSVAVRQHDKRGKGGYPWLLVEVAQKPKAVPNAVSLAAGAQRRGRGGNFG
ncbi:hypothetical protein [Solirhodobacter olei]|uniref:hypothetical protein n=1 Tax=Solirhodobacter olei TaxID=2493082 RepID=UPI000FDA4BE8|nr:hypothetical protein [Solirhodobacter olei]